MLILRPLKNRSVAWIWGGQVTSAIGDEISKVAIVWLIAGLIGNNTGYISALQAAAIFGFSILGGIVADRWDSRRTMIAVDILRGIAVLLIPVSIWVYGVNLYIVVILSLIISGLTAFFDPALKAFLPALIPDRPTLHAVNGLMETTGRLGRVIGPGFVGVINNAIPLTQFFVVDAFTYFISAFAISRTPKQKYEEEVNQLESDDSVWGSVQKDGLVKFILSTNSVVNAAWYLVFPLTLALMLHEKMPNNIGALGLIVAAYGVGNVLSNILVASYPMSNAVPWGFAGRILVGIGFVGMSLSPNIYWMMAAASLSATGGPMTDLSFLAVVQRKYSYREIARIFRLNMTISYGTLLVGLLISPKLFELVGFSSVIMACGSVMIFVGLLGHILFFKVER